MIILTIILTSLGVFLISNYAFCKGSRILSVKPGEEASNPMPGKNKNNESKLIIDTKLKLSKPLPLLLTQS
jgi:hypothetical protein